MQRLETNGVIERIRDQRYMITQKKLVEAPKTNNPLGDDASSVNDDTTVFSEQR